MGRRSESIGRTIAIAVAVTAVVLLAALAVALLPSATPTIQSPPLAPLCEPCLIGSELSSCPSGSSYAVQGCAASDDAYDSPIVTDRGLPLGSLEFWINGTTATYQLGPAEPALMGGWSIVGSNGTLLAQSDWDTDLSQPSGLSQFAPGISTTSQLEDGDALIAVFEPGTTPDVNYILCFASDVAGGSAVWANPP